ncbi:hypothetical protein ACS0PU_013196 [Formica fusca]
MQKMVKTNEDEKANEKTESEQTNILEIENKNKEQPNKQIENHTNPHEHGKYIIYQYNCINYFNKKN